MPILRSTNALADNNVLAVGDAGGLLDPVSGEGIYTAIWSGQIAARHLFLYLSGAVQILDGYRHQVENELFPDLQISRQLHDLFHLSPRFYMAIERRTSVLWKTLRRILIGSQTYTGVMTQHPKLATVIEFVSDFVRVTPRLQSVAGIRDPAPPQRFFLHSVKDT